MAGLDEDTVDEVLYLARAGEAAELEAYVSKLSAQTHRSKTELVIAAVDPYSKNSALHYAAANGHTDIIKLLFSTNAEKPAPALINAVNEAGNTPLHWAALNGHLESVKLLMQSGADVTIFNKAGHDAVFEAEINDKKEVVDWLLGAVEELEKGIGQTGEASSEDNVDEDMGSGDDDNGSDQNKLPQESTAAGASVEEVRKQVEGMKTRDGASQAG
ncbi:ankyrin repeat-containing domain protein [Pyrenochaeta sp. MPI-SDFR-AT-0127]|nr:ankyrin repeat-containing domain protein [Pyrenochaeta sp. MPI-SDFR-AT-0127]